MKVKQKLILLVATGFLSAAFATGVAVLQSRQAADQRVPQDRLESVPGGHVDDGMEQDVLRTGMLVAILAALAQGALAFWLIRHIGASLARSIAIAQKVAAGDLSGKIDAGDADEFGALTAALAKMQDELAARAARDGQVAAANLRIRQALDSTGSAVMVTDGEGRIVFVNRAAGRLFSAMEAEVRQELPQFSAAALVGSNFDQLHHELAQHRAMLSRIGSVHTARVRFGGRTMSIAVHPVPDEAGERIGYAVEWVDVTQELLAETEVEKVITAAADGHLTERVRLEGKSGFALAVARSLNVLLDASERVAADLRRVLGALADGRLTEKVSTQCSGEYAQLALDANQTVDKLVEVAQQIQLTADLVNSGAVQLSRGNEELSQRTTEQAASLEETAASIEQFTSTVKQNADNAAQANQVAAATRALAEKGGDVVGRAVVAMGEINEASHRIADIIGVIDEIAFQTNLLALNAAVEAARAGEQGRGFAVVAAEVRNLAIRSADSAREIKGLIQDSVGKVDGGTRLVDESGRTLGEIVASVKRMSDLIAEISAASREQAQGVEEVNRAVTQMDQVTTQNASLVDEASSSTQALAGQARSLAELVAFFDLGTVSSRRRAGTERPAAAPTAVIRAEAAAVSARRATPKPEVAAASARAAAPRVAAGGRDDEEWDSF